MSKTNILRVRKILYFLVNYYQIIMKNNALKNSRRDLMMSKIKSRIGEINYNNFGSEMVIKEN